MTLDLLLRRARAMLHQQDIAYTKDAMRQSYTDYNESQFRELPLIKAIDEALDPKLQPIMPLRPPPVGGLPLSWYPFHQFLRDVGSRQAGGRFWVCFDLDIHGQRVDLLHWTGKEFTDANMKFVSYVAHVTMWPQPPYRPKAVMEISI